MQIFGILNITEDSFSDGGLFLEKEKAFQQSRKLVLDGADTIDIGSQSSNPDSKIISEEIEWNRIFPVINFLQENFPQTLISIDTYKPKVILKSLQNKVHFINNIRAYNDPKLVEVLQEFRNTKSHFISMFSHNHGLKAKIESNLTPKTVVSQIDQFFENQINLFEKIGISTKQLIFDTGMGFFLSSNPDVSLEVLRKIDFFVEKYKQIMISVGKKSFIGKVFGDLPIENREIPNLLFENFLLQKGVSHIRTHNPKFLHQAKKINQILTSHETNI